MADRAVRSQPGKLVRDGQKGVPDDRQELCAGGRELERPGLTLKKGLATVAFQ
jgi:hypothetical protein